MKKLELTFTSKVLLYLVAAGDLMSPFMTSSNFKRKFLYGMPYDNYSKTVYYLHQKGYIRFIEKEDGRFIALTTEGQLEALLAKAKHPGPAKWDGKWRMMIFDIPEETRDKRNKLRQLLKVNNFFKLQASVYINPYPLNREAIKYLQETKLIEYIRIIKVEEMDNDKDLRKHFNL